MQVPDTNNYVTVDGAIHHNSGKSVGAVMGLVHLASKQPKDPKDGVRRSRFAVIRNTARMLSDTTQKTVFDWLPPGHAGQWQATKAIYTLRFGDVESEWMFRPLEHPNDVRNLLSLEITGAWINEYREILPEVLTNLLGRVGRYPRNAVDPSILMDTNPPPLGSYWHSLFENPSEEQKEQFAAYEEESGRPLFELFKQPGGRGADAENIENLPKNYYTTLIAANADRGENWVKVHVDGEYGQDPANAPVYPEYSHTLHASTRPLLANKRQPLCLGMDFGRSPAAVIGQQFPSGQWVILDEFVSENTGLENYLKRFLPWMAQRFPEAAHRSLASWQLWGDPSGQYGKETDEKTCFKILRAAGLTPRASFQEPTLRTGSVRRCLSRLLDGGEPGLTIAPTCKMLIRGFAGEYAYKRTSEGEMQPQARKNAASHPHDALQYLLAAYEGPALKGANARKPKQMAGGFFKPIVVQDKWKPW